VTITDQVNARAGPGTDYGTLGQIESGALARVTGRLSDNTWWQIAYAGAPGGVGWVFGELVTADAAAANAPAIAAPPPSATLTPTSVRPGLTYTPTRFHTPTPTPTGLRRRDDRRLPTSDRTASAPESTPESTPTQAPGAGRADTAHAGQPDRLCSWPGCWWWRGWCQAAAAVVA
jgi:uncharacterized protein YraI